jgi:hypothetical protein
MSSLVVVSTLVWVPCTAFELHTHASMASLTMRLGFRTLALLPWQALG